jgi:integrase
MKRKRGETWSVTGITHHDYPDFGKVWVAEFPNRGSALTLFRLINGKQETKSLGRLYGRGPLFRRELGAREKDQINEVRRLACAYIEREMQDKPTATTSATLTWQQLIDRYEATGFAGKTDDYKRDTIASLRRVAASVGTNSRIVDLKPSQLTAHYAKRAKEYPSAARGDLVTAKIACLWAWREKLLAQKDNPFTQSEFAKVIPPQPPHRRPIAKFDRYETIKMVAHKLPPAFEVLLDLSWETGKSHGGIRTLKWKDVSLTPTKTAPHGVVTWYADRELETTDTKKRRRHTRPLNANASAALARWRKRNKAVGGFVFPNPNDPTKPLDYPTTKRWMRRAETLAKVPHFKQGIWHPYRRGWALARAKDFSPAEIAAANDWQDPAMVVMYQAADEEAAAAAATFVA